MTVCVHVDHEEAQLLGVVAAIFRRRFDAKQLRVVLAKKGGRRQQIAVGIVVTVIEEAVHMPGEQRLYATPLYH